MPEIDLIPESYRARQRSLSLLRAGGTLLAASVLLAVAGHWFLSMQADATEFEVRELQVQKAISQQQRTQLEQLELRRADLQQQLDLLSGLRGGTTALMMFETVDRAVNPGQVWFTDWQFRRAGTRSDADPTSLQAGYFIVIRNQAPKEEETWVIQTEMQIAGEAVDHAALSDFVSNLIGQPEISHVRIVNTETVERYQRPLVRFSLDVRVGS